MLSCLKNIDLITSTPRIYINSKKRYNNFFGGILTLIYIFSVLIISIILFIRFILRDNITSIYNEELINNPKYNLENSPLFFQVYDQTGTLIPEANRIYRFSALTTKIEITFKNGIPVRNVVNSNVILKNCSEVMDLFASHKNLVLSNFYQDKICIDPRSSISLEGSGGDGGNSTSLIVNVEKCSNTTTSKNCFPSEYINRVLVKPIFMIRFLDFNVNNNDIDNPIHNYIKGDMVFFSGQMTKIVTYYFGNVDYISDTGFFFNGFFERKFTKFYEKALDISPLIIGTDLIFRVNFTLSKIKAIYTRNYQKIQNLIANISGVHNVFYFIIKLLDELVIDSFILNYIANFINIFEHSSLGQDINKTNFKKYFLTTFIKNKFSNSNIMKIKSPTHIADKRLNLNKYDRFQTLKVKENDNLSSNINIQTNNNLFPKNENLNNQISSNLEKNSSNLRINQENYLDHKINGINIKNNKTKILNNITNQNVGKGKKQKINNIKNINLINNRNSVPNAKFFIPSCVDLFIKKYCFRLNPKVRIILSSENYIKKKLSVEMILKKFIEFDKFRFYILEKEEISMSNSIPGPNIFKDFLLFDRTKGFIVSEKKNSINAPCKGDSFFNEININDNKDYEELWNNYEF